MNADRARPVLVRELLEPVRRGGRSQGSGDAPGGRRAEASAAPYGQLDGCPIIGPIVFGRGVSLELEVDEIPFAGVSLWLTGAVLEQFFARHVSINSFTGIFVCDPCSVAPSANGDTDWPPVTV